MKNIKTKKQIRHWHVQLTSIWTRLTPHQITLVASATEGFRLFFFYCFLQKNRFLTSPCSAVMGRGTPLLEVVEETWQRLDEWRFGSMKMHQLIIVENLLVIARMVLIYAYFLWTLKKHLKLKDQLTLSVSWKTVRSFRWRMPVFAGL